MHWEASAGALVVGLTGDRGSMAPSLSSEASGHLMRHRQRDPTPCALDRPGSSEARDVSSLQRRAPRPHGVCSWTSVLHAPELCGVTMPGLNELPVTTPKQHGGGGGEPLKRKASFCKYVIHKCPSDALDASEKPSESITAFSLGRWAGTKCS